MEVKVEQEDKREEFQCVWPDDLADLIASGISAPFRLGQANSWWLHQP